MGDQLNLIKYHCQYRGTNYLVLGKRELDRYLIREIRSSYKTKYNTKQSTNELTTFTNECYCKVQYEPVIYIISIYYYIYCTYSLHLAFEL